MHNDDGYDKFVSCFQLMNYLVIILNDYNIWFEASTNYTRNIPRKLQWSTNKLFEFTPKKKKNCLAIKKRNADINFIHFSSASSS